MNKFGLATIAVVVQAHSDLKLALMMEEAGLEWSGSHYDGQKSRSLASMTGVTLAASNGVTRECNESFGRLFGKAVDVKEIIAAGMQWTDPTFTQK